VRVGPSGPWDCFLGCALWPCLNLLKAFEICPSREGSTLLATCYISTTAELFLQYVSCRRISPASLRGHFHELCGQCGWFPCTECYVLNQVRWGAIFFPLPGGNPTPARSSAWNQIILALWPIQMLLRVETRRLPEPPGSCPATTPSLSSEFEAGFQPNVRFVMDTTAPKSPNTFGPSRGSDAADDKSGHALTDVGERLKRLRPGPVEVGELPASTSPA
jgi:hypothetical protein